MTETWDETLPVETTAGGARALPRAAWAALPLRLVLGFGFMFHGFPKVFTAEGNAGFVSTLEGLGVPAPGVTAWLVGLLEFFGGLGLIVGALVVPLSLLLAIEMVVAMVLVHLPHGFSFMNVEGMSADGPIYGPPGYEVNLLYIAGLLALALTGAGPLSLDHGARTVRTREGHEYVGMRSPPV